MRLDCEGSNSKNDDDGFPPLSSALSERGIRYFRNIEHSDRPPYWRETASIELSDETRVRGGHFQPPLSAPLHTSLPTPLLNSPLSSTRIQVS